MRMCDHMSSMVCLQWEGELFGLPFDEKDLETVIVELIKMSNIFFGCKNLSIILQFIDC